MALEARLRSTLNSTCSSYQLWTGELQIISRPSREFQYQLENIPSLDGVGFGRHLLAYQSGMSRSQAVHARRCPQLVVLEGNPHGRSECRGVGASGQTAMGCGASQAKSHLQEAPAPSEATTGTTKTSESVARKVEKLEIETSAAVAESYTESPVASPVASPLASAPTPASPSKSRPRAPKAPQATWIENGRSYRKTPGRATAMRRRLGKGPASFH